MPGSSPQTPTWPGQSRKACRAGHTRRAAGARSGQAEGRACAVPFARIRGRFGRGQLGAAGIGGARRSVLARAVRVAGGASDRQLAERDIN